jgi:hypothetical protein
MTDYQPLIARAVEGLGRSTGEARRSLYDRARSALVAQLRGVEPSLPESEITRERLALEEAIRKVEADAARKARAEPRPPATPPPSAPPRRPPAGANEPPPARRAEPAPPMREPDEEAPPPPPRPAAPPTARSRLLSARSSTLTQEGLRGFRDVVNEVDDLGGATAKSARSARDTRDSYGSGAQRMPRADELTPPHSLHDEFEPQLDAEEIRASDYEEMQIEPSSDAEDEEPAVSSRSMRPHPPRTAEAEEDYEEPRPPRSYRGMIRLAVLLIILLGIGATVSWQWSNITGVYQFFARHGSRSQTQTTQTPVTQPKYSGRVPQDQGAAPGNNAGTPGGQTVPTVAQRVVLYEEDPNDPQGKRFVGSAIWRTETVSPGPGLAPELAVRADIEIPERRMTVTWSLRRNTDKALPASHTIEVMFNLPADFPGGGISNVPGILMKQSEQARGTPLAGLAVKVTTGFFLIGLSAVDADMQRNIQLLKERPWFDIPVVYTNGGRAILAMEKGPPGERAFAEAFAAWGK